MLHAKVQAFCLKQLFIAEMDKIRTVKLQTWKSQAFNSTSVFTLKLQINAVNLVSSKFVLVSGKHFICVYK